MKKIAKFIVGLLLIVVVLGIALVYSRPMTLGDVFYKHEMYGISASLYERGYNSTNTVEDLYKLCQAYVRNPKPDYGKEVNYLGKLLKEEQFLSTKSDSDLIKVEYLQALFNTGQKEKFKQYLSQAKFDEEIDSNFRVMGMVLSNSKSTNDDYEVAIEQGAKLLKGQTLNDKLLVLYPYMIDLYKKVGDDKSAQKYSDDLKSYMNEHNINNNNNGKVG